MESRDLLLGLLSITVAAGCSLGGPERATSSVAAERSAEAVVDEDDEAGERTVPPDRIPGAVKEAALAAVPGLVITEAEIENGGAAYCVHGTVDGAFCEVEVSAAGDVLEIEHGPDDDEDDRDRGR